LLASETVNPPVGAGAVIVTALVEFFPPVTLAGVRVSVFTAGGLTVNVAVTELPLSDAVMVTSD